MGIYRNRYFANAKTCIRKLLEFALSRQVLRTCAGNAGWSSPVARQAHNLKAAGSNPAPATNSKTIKTFAASQQGPVAIFTSSTRRTETGHDNRRSRLGHAGLYPYIAQSKASIAPHTNTPAVGKRGSKSRVAVEQAAIAPARRPPSASWNNETTPAITSPMPIGAIPTAAAALRQYPLRCWDMHRLSSNNVTLTIVLAVIPPMVRVLPLHWDW